MYSHVPRRQRSYSCVGFCLLTFKRAHIFSKRVPLMPGSFELAPPKALRSFSETLWATQSCSNTAAQFRASILRLLQQSRTPESHSESVYVATDRRLTPYGCLHPRFPPLTAQVCHQIEPESRCLLSACKAELLID